LGAFDRAPNWFKYNCYYDWAIYFNQRLLDRVRGPYFLLRPSSAILGEIEQLNSEKRNLIVQYMRAQDSAQIPFDQKVRNTYVIYEELRRKNQSLTELECEFISSLSYE
jgi:hypothetical protein